MQLDRTKITIKKQDKQDDSYMDASPQERIAFVWELTAEVWSIRNAEDVEQRLQRNVTKLIRIKEVMSPAPADTVKKMKKLPESVLHPVTAKKFRTFSRDELHDKQRTMHP